MRMKLAEIQILKSKLKTLASDAKLYLFGSRTDNSKQGGDIDLLVISKTLTKQDLRLLRVDFFNHFGEQKLDILLNDGSFKDPFHKIIYQKAVLL